MSPKIADWSSMLPRNSTCPESPQTLSELHQTIVFWASPDDSTRRADTDLS